jgi:hypothetical protein
MIMALLLAFCLLTALPFAVQAEEKEVTLNRVILVSDTQLIMEFSEPIAVSLKEASDPYVAVRVVKPGQGSPQKADDGATNLQWAISLKYLDAKHDRLLGTLAGTALGVSNISDIINWKGALAAYADRGWEVRLVVEEKNESGDGGNDGKVCNITNVDGSVMLTGVQSSGYESARMEIIEDRSYSFDASKAEPVKEEVEAEPENEELPYSKDWLTVKRAVQVSKNQIIVEFSEPIAIGLTQSKSPFVGLRLVKKGGNAAIRTDDDRMNLQWMFSMQFLDSNHDRLLLTLSSSTLEITSIDDIRNFSGELARYADRGWEMRLVIEELPDDKTNYSDGGVCNITTPDGKKMLFPTHISGYESVSILVERDFTYPFDESKTESTQVTMGLDANTILIMDGAEYLEAKNKDDQNSMVVVKTIEVVKNNPWVVGVVIATSGLIALTIVLVTLFVSRKRKAAK